VACEVANNELLLYDLTMRDVVLTVLILGSLPFILSRPWFGVLMWTWIGVMNPHRLTWGFAYGWPFAMLVAIPTFIAIMLSRERMRFPLMPASVAFLMFMFWTTFTTLFALYPDDAWHQWQKVAKIQLFILVTMLVMQDRRYISWLIWVAMASVAFYGVKGGLYTIRGGGSGMVLGPSGGFTEGNTEIALAITMTIPLMYYLAATTNKTWVKWGLGIGMVLCAIAVLGSQSRGGFLAVAGMVVFLWLKSKRKFTVGLLLLLLAPAILSLMPESWYQRMETIKNYEADRSAMGRINAWHFAFKLALSRPITGGGFETFNPHAFLNWAPNPSDFHDAHSIWFEVLGEHGFVGLALFALMWFLTWRLGRSIIRDSDKRKDMRDEATLARAIQVSLVGYWIGASFLGLSYFDLPYILLAILVLTRAALDRQLTQEKQQSEGRVGAEAAPVIAPPPGASSHTYSGVKL
jgi:putative inorganic carbon (hco3(-)) transporter